VQRRERTILKVHESSRNAFFRVKTQPQGSGEHGKLGMESNAKLRSGEKRVLKKEPQVETLKDFRAERKKGRQRKSKKLWKIVEGRGSQNLCLDREREHGNTNIEKERETFGEGGRALEGGVMGLYAKSAPAGKG